MTSAAHVGTGSAPRVARSRISLIPRDPVRIALFLLAIITLSRIHQEIKLLAVLRPAWMLTLVALCYAFLRPNAIDPGVVLRRWPGRVLIALAALAVLSAIFGISFGASASYILTDYSKVLVFGALLMMAIRNARDLRLFLWAFVVATALLVWMALTMFDLSLASGSHAYRLSNLHTYDANDLGCVLVTALPLTLLVNQASRGRAKVVTMVVMLGIGAALARSGSRGAFVGLVVVVVALLLLSSHVAVGTRLGFTAALLAGLIFAAPPGYWKQMETILAPTEDYNWEAENGRKAVALRGLGYMMSYPAFGIGVGNFGRAEGMISDKARYHVEGTGIRWSAAHNSFIQAAAELGIPGFLVWSGLLVGGMLSLFRIRRRLPRHWARGDPDERLLYAATLYIPIALLGFAVSSSFVSFAYLDVYYVLAAYITGTYAAIAVKRREFGSAALAVSAAGLAAAARSRGPSYAAASSRG